MDDSVPPLPPKQNRWPWIILVLVVGLVAATSGVLVGLNLDETRVVTEEVEKEVRVTPQVCIDATFSWAVAHDQSEIYVDSLQDTLDLAAEVATPGYIANFRDVERAEANVERQRELRAEIDDLVAERGASDGRVPGRVTG